MHSQCHGIRIKCFSNAFNTWCRFCCRSFFVVIFNSMLSLSSLCMFVFVCGKYHFVFAALFCWIQKCSVHREFDEKSPAHNNKKINARHINEEREKQTEYVPEKNTQLNNQSEKIILIFIPFLFQILVVRCMLMCMYTHTEIRTE